MHGKFYKNQMMGLSAEKLAELLEEGVSTGDSCLITEAFSALALQNNFDQLCETLREISCFDLRLSSTAVLTRHLARAGRDSPSLELLGIALSYARYLYKTGQRARPTFIIHDDFFQPLVIANSFSENLIIEVRRRIEEWRSMEERPKRRRKKPDRLDGLIAMTTLQEAVRAEKSTEAETSTLFNYDAVELKAKQLYEAGELYLKPDRDSINIAIRMMSYGLSMRAYEDRGEALLDFIQVNWHDPTILNLEKSSG